MDLCQNYNQKIDELLNSVKGLPDIHFELEKITDNESVMSLVKKFITLRNECRRLSAEVMASEPLRIIKNELHASKSSFSEITKVISDKYSDYVAIDSKNIKESTLLYIGQLNNDVFKYPNILEYYTKYPDGQIMQKEITIGGKSGEELLKTLKDDGTRVTKFAEYMMRSDKFAPSAEEEKVKLVFVKAADLGLYYNITDYEVFRNAAASGLQKAPAEVAPYLRTKVALGTEWRRYWVIGMDPLKDPENIPNLFTVRDEGGERWLSNVRGDTSGIFPEEAYFVFVRPKNKA